MTLSRFLRDYLYFPLGGNRKGARRRTINLMATMLLGGLWHGAGWTFVLWGAIHGVYLVVNHLWRRLVPHRDAAGSARLAWGALTFVAVVVAWVPFRASSLHAACSMLAGMVGLHGLSVINAVSPYAPGDLWMAPAKPVDWTHGALWITGLLVVVWGFPNTQEIFARQRGVDSALRPADSLPTASSRWCWRPSTAWAVLTALALAGALTQFGETSEFIYFQF